MNAPAPQDVTATLYPDGWYATLPLSELRRLGHWRGEVCGRALTLKAGAPPTGELDAQPAALQVQAGVIFVWSHHAHAPPSWRLSPLSEEPGWTPMSFTRQEMDIRPLQVMRDLADVLHFETVHRYKDVDPVEPLRAEGPRLFTRVAFGWDTGLPWSIPAGFTSRVEGPGFQLTDVRVSVGLWVSRHVVMPAPIDAERTALHLGVSVRLTGLLGRLEARLGGAVMSPVKGLIHRFLAFAFKRDVARDAQLWRSLAEGPGVPQPEDPTLARFHAWAAQFA